jgi:hypothetical protein
VSIEAMKMALEALDGINSPLHMTELRSMGKAITALRAAIAEASMHRLTDVQQEMEPTIKDNLTVEPVAYVTGYSKGYATVRPVDPCLLMCVGMALYRSPPNQSEDALGMVEPLYSASPKRKPLTKEQLLYVYNQLPNWGMDMDNISQNLVAFARAIERAHGIGGEE